MSNVESAYKLVGGVDIVISHIPFIQPLFYFINNGRFDQSIWAALPLFISFWERRVNLGTIPMAVAILFGQRREMKNTIQNLDSSVRLANYVQRLITHGIAWGTAVLIAYKLLSSTP